VEVLLAARPIPLPHRRHLAAGAALPGRVAAAGDQERGHDRGISCAEESSMLHTQTASGSPPVSEDHAPLIVVRAKRSHRGHDVTSLLVGMCLAEQGIEQGAPARGHRTRQRHLHLPAMRISLTPRERRRGKSHEYRCDLRNLGLRIPAGPPRHRHRQRQTEADDGRAGRQGHGVDRGDGGRIPRDNLAGPFRRREGREDRCRADWACCLDRRASARRQSAHWRWRTSMSSPSTPTTRSTRTTRCLPLTRSTTSFTSWQSCTGPQPLQGSRDQS
jgi:hypothetical protein